MKLKYSKDVLEDIVSNSKSKRECLLKLKLKPYGEYYRILDKYIEVYKLNTSHFVDQGWNVNDSPADLKAIDIYVNKYIIAYMSTTSDYKGDFFILP